MKLINTISLCDNVQNKLNSIKRTVLNIHIILFLFFCIFLFLTIQEIPSQEKSIHSVIDIGSSLELFVDHYLIDTMEGIRLKLHEPQLREVALTFDRPWEGRFCGYITVIKDGNHYKMYYRGIPTAGADGSGDEVTCYAESDDGIHWIKPNLGIFEVSGARDNNVILCKNPPFSHNFSPFLDTRQGISSDERFKALAGTEESGLFGFISADGIRWKKVSEKSLLTKGAFDSQNVSFWSEAEGCYICYFRTWTGGSYAGYRTVSRATSKDFLNWSEPVQMKFGDTPPEHLYTNQTHPYFRAPHIYVSLPMRFMPGRKVLTDEQAKSLNVYVDKDKPSNTYANDCAEVAFMTSRGGNKYDRTFMEGFIRPGLDAGNWASRAGLAALGIVPTSPTEISIYKQNHYAQPTSSLARYTLRTDGFVSLNAPYQGGELITKVLKHSGKELLINFSTSAAGGIRIEILNEEGVAIPGFTLQEADEIVGDSIERIVSWKGKSDVSALAGIPIKLRFVMKDADVFAIRFK